MLVIPELEREVVLLWETRTMRKVRKQVFLLELTFTIHFLQHQQKNYTPFSFCEVFNWLLICILSFNPSW